MTIITHTALSQHSCITYTSISTTALSQHSQRTRTLLWHHSTQIHSFTITSLSHAVTTPSQNPIPSFTSPPSHAHHYVITTLTSLSCVSHVTRTSFPHHFHDTISLTSLSHHSAVHHLEQNTSHLTLTSFSHYTSFTHHSHVISQYSYITFTSKLTHSHIAQNNTLTALIHHPKNTRKPPTDNSHITRKPNIRHSKHHSLITVIPLTSLSHHYSITGTSQLTQIHKTLHITLRALSNH